MKINEILTEDKIRIYNNGWKEFKQKNIVNTSKNVHSGMPVISQVYRFEDYPIFRAHIFGRRLMKFDPYHIADRCIQPFWHAQHYFAVGEQMYTASSKLVVGDDYDKKFAKEVPVQFNWKRPLFFADNISVELIRMKKGSVGRYDAETGYFTFYSDKTGKNLSAMAASSYWQPRAFIQDIERLKKGEKQAIDDLIRKVESQAVNHARLRKPRTTLVATKTALIDALRTGKIPEDELIDFFSLWE